MKKSRYLITGSSSGLGKYLNRELKGVALNRDGLMPKKAKIIIHCAFNKDRNIDSRNLYQYICDNVFLTKRLAKIPHKKFIFVSSVDVYPKDNNTHSEKEIIDIDQVSGSYAVTKLMSESIVQNLCSNFLILRCTALLGRDSKKNSLIKILKDNNPDLTVSAKSVFNIILHKDVLEFIKIAVEKDLQGIYNIASSQNISILEVAKLMKKKVNFGKYTYNVGDIDNKKTLRPFPNLKRTSIEAINEFTKLIK
jgi:nucleoside-diphosphate-sugar epimerase